MDEGLSIEELCSLAGVDRRTVRFYVEQGLLAGPQSAGRYARYPESDGDRLLAIVQMKLQGKSLAEIRTSMVTMSPGEVRQVGAQSVARIQAEEIIEEQSGSALDYLLRLKRSGGGSWSPGERPDRSSAQTPIRRMVSRGNPDVPPLAGHPDRPPLERLIEVLESHGGPTRTRGSSETWTRYEVTKDFEIHIRGEQTDEEKVSYQRLAAHLRSMLLGGGSGTDEDSKR